MKYGNAILDPQLRFPASSERESHTTLPGRDEQSSIISCQASPVAERNSTSTACGNV